VRCVCRNDIAKRWRRKIFERREPSGINKEEALYNKKNQKKAKNLRGGNPQIRRWKNRVFKILPEKVLQGGERFSKGYPPEENQNQTTGNRGWVVTEQGES